MPDKNPGNAYKAGTRTTWHVELDDGMYAIGHSLARNSATHCAIPVVTEWQAAALADRHDKTCNAKPGVTPEHQNKRIPQNNYGMVGFDWLHPEVLQTNLEA